MRCCSCAVSLLWLCFVLCSFALVQSKQLIPNGSQQFYEVVNQVAINDLKHSSSQEASYIFRTHLRINSVWNRKKEQLLQIFFTKSSVAAPGKVDRKLVTQEIKQIPDRPFYVSLVDGVPRKVIAHTSRDQSLLNLERGIASLLQVRYENGPDSELDVSGHCNAFYLVKSSTRIEKTKTECSHWDLRVIYRPEKALGIALESQAKINFDLSAEGTLRKVESVEIHRVRLEAKPDVGSEIESLLHMKHLTVGDEVVEQLNFRTLKEAVDSLLEWYRVFDLEADVDGVLSEIKGVTLKQQIAAVANQLTNEFIGKASLALSLAKLFPLARITKQAEFVEILQDQKELHGQLVDLLGAVQTTDSHNAINEYFDYNNKAHADLLEKYLQSLAVGTHPERSIIEDLYERLQSSDKAVRNEKLRDSIIQTMAALTRQSGLDLNDPLHKNVRSMILEELGKCKEAACKTLYIRSLQNLQDISTISVLVEMAVKGDAGESVAAMQALKSFPIIFFTDKHRKTFAQIFYQTKRKYDSSARTLALDILLALKPTKQQLGDLLDYLASNDRQYEMKTYVIQKLRMSAEKCARFGAVLKACLAERPQVNNYHIIAQKGLTTVLLRQLSQTPAFNESLLSVQEISEGVLKRGSVELVLNAGQDEIRTFKIGMYTNGLSSLVGDGDDTNGDDAEEDDSPATAGMEISVQDVLMRPLVFFSGQSELMGHVWSGTASEPTPAYQATTLAQDHENYVILSSGATVYVRVIGMKSVDLNGKVELSIWNRNANTEIQQNSGAAVVGVMVAGFTYGQVENQFTLTNEPKISLQADIDFYSGIKLCMQLQRPEMILTHANTKKVSLAGTSAYKKVVRTKFTYKAPGRTLALNQKNNEMCNTIFN